MEKLLKIYRGEYGLTSTFWFWYLGISFLLAIVYSAIGTFVDLTRTVGSVGLLIILAWVVFASLAVINSASYDGSRGLWGWLATIWVTVSTLRALYSTYILLS